MQVSPIEYGHILLVPRVLDCLPQRIDEDSFLLALHMAAEANNPYFRVGYNSLGAFATINHLHFQVDKTDQPRLFVNCCVILCQGLLKQLYGHLLYLHERH